MSSNNTKPSKNRTDALLTDTSTFNHKQFADLYYKFNKNKYIVSPDSGWYSYNKYNVLINHKKDPLNINNDIINFLIKYIQDEMETINVVDDLSKKIFDDLFNVYKKVSNADYISGIIKLLKGLYLDEEIDAKIDAKTELFAFTNKVFDVKEGIYRDIEKNDYILSWIRFFIQVR